MGFESISVVNQNVGWIVGGNGHVYATTNGGIVSVDNDAQHSVEEFVLHQNYPNPFNPTTKIVYGIPSRAFVELKLFDVLGREVATLVSELKRPGAYTVKWNAQDYPSGVYFYRLSTNGFVETKKLLLLR
jgi:hypothetical protein